MLSHNSLNSVLKKIVSLCEHEADVLSLFYQCLPGLVGGL